MDIEVETLIASLSDDQVREILIEAARNHNDVLETIKSVGTSSSSVML
jgi:hypothetical protein